MAGVGGMPGSPDPSLGPDGDRVQDDDQSTLRGSAYGTADGSEQVPPQQTSSTEKEPKDIRFQMPSVPLDRLNYSVWRYAVMSVFCALVPEDMEVHGLRYWEDIQLYHRGVITWDEHHD